MNRDHYCPTMSRAKTPTFILVVWLATAVAVASAPITTTVITSTTLDQSDDEDTLLTTTTTSYDTASVTTTSSTRSVEYLNRYIRLLKEWSVAFVSGSNLYLARFDEPVAATFGNGNDEFLRRVVTCNLTLTPFFRNVLRQRSISDNDNSYDDDDDAEIDNSTSSSSSSSWSYTSFEFKRIQYHRPTNNLVFLTRSGTLFTFNTANLAADTLRVRHRVLDFSMHEDLNVFYYAVEDGGMVKVLRAFVGYVNDSPPPHEYRVGDKHMWLDESMVNTALTVFVTRPESVRLHVDYDLNSLYLFIVINARVFTYELKLFYDDSTAVNTCDARCDRRFEVKRVSRFRVTRPLLNFDYYDFVRKHGDCDVLDFRSLRDRLIEIEFYCPSANIERVHARRMANWMKDLRKSNVTFDALDSDYVYSTMLDARDHGTGQRRLRRLTSKTTRNGGGGAPVRLELKKSRSNDGQLVHSVFLERVGFVNTRDVYVDNVTEYENGIVRRNRETRRHVGSVDGIASYGLWRDVERIDSLFVRQPELFRDVRLC